jgi:hypothetical protein
MDKKAASKPVAEIMRRLAASGEFEVVPFGDATILHAPVADWPVCDVLLAWHSDGFPLAKAQAYANLRRPYLINDVHSQPLLLDRRQRRDQVSPWGDLPLVHQSVNIGREFGCGRTGFGPLFFARVDLVHFDDGL